MSGLAAAAFLGAFVTVFLVALAIPRIMRWRERRHLDAELRELLDAERRRREDPRN